MLADLTGNLQLSFLLPVGCYLFLIYYGIWGYSSDGHEAQPGALGVVQNGDVITLDVPARMLHINLTEEELRQRKTLWQDSQRLVGRGYIHLFQQHVQQSHLGADFDFLRGCSGSEVVRDSH